MGYLDLLSGCEKVFEFTLLLLFLDYVVTIMWLMWRRQEGSQQKSHGLYFVQED